MKRRDFFKMLPFVAGVAAVLPKVVKAKPEYNGVSPFLQMIKNMKPVAGKPEWHMRGLVSHINENKTQFIRTVPEYGIEFEEWMDKATGITFRKMNHPLLEKHWKEAMIFGTK